MSTPQEEFDATYITSAEIRRYLNVSRSTIVQGKERGLLPEPILVQDGQVQLWKREQVQPFLDAWRLMLQVRRGEVTA